MEKLIKKRKDTSTETLFMLIDATITANYFYYGEPKDKVILVNKVIDIDASKITMLKEQLISSFGEFSHQNTVYTPDKSNVKYEVVIHNAATLYKTKSHPTG